MYTVHWLGHFFGLDSGFTCPTKKQHVLLFCISDSGQGARTLLELCDGSVVSFGKGTCSSAESQSTCKLHWMLGSAVCAVAFFSTVSPASPRHCIAPPSVVRFLQHFAASCILDAQDTVVMRFDPITVDFDGARAIAAAKAAAIASKTASAQARSEFLANVAWLRADRLNKGTAVQVVLDGMREPLALPSTFLMFKRTPETWDFM